jgi:hypothetical protein
MIFQAKLISWLFFIASALAISLSTDEFVRSQGYIFYFLQIAVLLFCSLRVTRSAILYLSPSFLSILYLGLSFGFGQYVLYHEITFGTLYTSMFQKITDLPLITIFLLLCSQLIYYSSLQKRFLVNEFQFEKPTNPAPSSVTIVLILLAIVFLSFVEIDLSFLGGAGNFNYAFQLALAVFLVFSVQGMTKLKRIMLYVILITTFAVGSFQSKREILYVFILIGFFEALYANFKISLNIKKALLGISSLGLIFMIFMVSSISRGYGGFGVENPIDAIEYVDDYLASETIQKSLTNNFELATVYGNTINPIDYALTGQLEYGMGSTFTKFLFIPIPRSVYPDKPKSMIDIYTSKFYPSFRDKGGSLPVTIYGEVFYNFWFIGAILLVILFYWFNKLYYLMVENLLDEKITFRTFITIYLYITFIQFVRGSGLDLWLVYLLVATPLLYILKINFFNKKKKNVVIN